MKPNFFILGAPKCGTTSLAAWLAEHPDVFVSNPKEPFHFNSDYKHVNPIRSQAAYQRLFRTARHSIRGEGTTFYLVSDIAVDNILRYAPDARFIVCLRDPVDMALSLHAYLLKQGQENIADFQTAWNAQDDRRAGRNIPPGCQDRKMLDYERTCSLGQQVERLLARVEPHRVHFILLEDWRDPRPTWTATLAFLGAPDDGRNTFPVVNEGRKLRVPFIAQTMAAAGLVKHKLGISHGFGVQSTLARINECPGKPPPPPPDVVDSLKRHFDPDVQRLASLIRRDLSHWRPNAHSNAA